MRGRVKIKFRDGDKEFEIDGPHSEVDALLEKWVPRLVPELFDTPKKALDQWLATRPK